MASDASDHSKHAAPGENFELQPIYDHVPASTDNQGPDSEKIEASNWEALTLVIIAFVERRDAVPMQNRSFRIRLRNNLSQLSNHLTLLKTIQQDMRDIIGGSTANGSKLAAIQIEKLISRCCELIQLMYKLAEKAIYFFDNQPHKQESTNCHGIQVPSTSLHHQGYQDSPTQIGYCLEPCNLNGNDDQENRQNKLKK